MDTADLDTVAADTGLTPRYRVDELPDDIDLSVYAAAVEHINDHEPTSQELTAFFADHLPRDCNPLRPRYEAERLLDMFDTFDTYTKNGTTHYRTPQ